MKHQRLSCIWLLSCLTIISATSFALGGPDSRMLTQPAVSAKHIAFIYAEDLWIALPDGSQPQRLTVDRGVESSPEFSPDGQTIAFSAQYDGNTDVYVIPVTGGIPKRLTWHPSADFVRGFTPDGKSVLFASQRAAFNNRYLQLFTVPVTGGMSSQLEIPNAFWATYSPDGKQMAYTPLQDAFRQWKHYRGGMISTIMIFSFTDKSVVKIPQPEGGCNDVDPMWLGNTIYFRSDRDGEFNIYAYNTGTKKIDVLTSFNDFPVLNAAATDGRVVFEQAGYLHVYMIGASAATPLKIGISADLPELRSRFVSGMDYIRSADISPSGARAVFDCRGEIITVPAEKGDYRNITQTPGSHEKFPAWSPDGKTIAYFSDASGEYQLYLGSQDGKSTPRVFKLNGSGFYAFPAWSPDSKKISFTDNARNLFIIDIASGNIIKIDSDELYAPGAFRNIFSDWSSDSKWIAYTKVTKRSINESIFIHSIKRSQWRLLMV